MMSHNINRRPNYPKEGEKNKPQDKRNKRLLWRHVLYGIIVLTPLLCIFTPKIIKDRRLNRNHVETSARITDLYKSGRGQRIKCVSYSFCVDSVWYEGNTSPSDSIWDNTHIGAPFEIVYERGNPSNNNWAEYYKKK